MLALFVLALAARITVAMADPHPVWDGVIYMRGATDIAAGRGYTHRILVKDLGSRPPLPTAFYPVGHPLALAAAIFVAGDRRASPSSPTNLRATLALQLLLGALHAPLVWLLARRFVKRKRALTAGLAVALWPQSVLLSVSWFGEPLFTLLLLLAAIAIARRRRFGSAGAILGAAALVRPTAILISACTWLATRGSIRAKARASALSLGVTLCVLSPWAVRNKIELGSWVIVSTNGGVNALIGTFGSGTYASVPNGEDCSKTLAEVPKDRCRSARAAARWRAAPLDQLKRAGIKTAATLFGASSPADAYREAIGGGPPWLSSLGDACSFLHVMLLVAACVGVAQMRASRRSALEIALPAIVSILAAHALTIGGDRYNAPLVPFFIVLASAASVQRGTRMYASSPTTSS